MITALEDPALFNFPHDSIVLYSCPLLRAVGSLNLLLNYYYKFAVQQDRVTNISLVAGKVVGVLNEEIAHWQVCQHRL